MSRKITRSCTRKKQGRKVKNDTLFCPQDKAIYLIPFEEFKKIKRLQEIDKTTRETLLSEKLPHKKGEIILLYKSVNKHNNILK